VLGNERAPGDFSQGHPTSRARRYGKAWLLCPYANQQLSVSPRLQRKKYIEEGNLGGKGIIVALLLVPPL
jgi:hypothetical protein